MNKLSKDIIKGTNKLEEKYIDLKKMLDKQTIYKDLTVPLGVTEDGKYHYVGFEDIGCLLVTGETGSGKSIFLDTIIISLVLRNKIGNIKFIMMDPKRIELSYYNDLPHIKGNMISDSNKCYKKLLEVEREYKERIELFKNKKIKDIEEYNELNKNLKLYHLFIIIDESCDLMKEDNSEKLLSSMINDCYKYGIHFIIATNSYNEEYFSKDFINNIKYKITFDLATKADAKMVKEKDSDKLPTPGEAIATSKKQKVKYKLQTPYISDEDIMRVINYFKKD